MKAAQNSVMVTSAVPFSKAQQTKLEEHIREKSGAAVDVSFVVDEKILGGFTITVAGQKIDASLRGELTQLVQTLKASV